LLREYCIAQWSSSSSVALLITFVITILIFPKELSALGSDLKIINEENYEINCKSVFNGTINVQRPMSRKYCCNRKK